MFNARLSVDWLGKVNRTYRTTILDCVQEFLNGKSLLFIIIRMDVTHISTETNAIIGHIVSPETRRPHMIVAKRIISLHRACRNCHPSDDGGFMATNQKFQFDISPNARRPHVK